VTNRFDFSVLKRPAVPHNVIIIGDFLKDLDDEHSLCGIAGLTKLGFVSLKAVVANLAPAELRARGAKGTLNTLGLSSIPVGVGFPIIEGDVDPYEANLPYLASSDEVNPSGTYFLVKTLLQCPDDSVILVLQSGMIDATVLLSMYRNLVMDKVKIVAIMGGVETDREKVILCDDGMMIPNNANNNSFDMQSAIRLYWLLQSLNIPMVVTTREAAYAAQVPFKAYDEFEETGNPIGACLKNRQLPSMQHLWEAACSPAGSKIRGTLPDDRNRKWFVRVYCDGVDPEIGSTDSIWPYVRCFNLYDPTNLYAAIPELREYFLKPHIVHVGETDHMIVGLSKQNNGVVNPEQFSKFMVDIELLGLQ